MNDRPVKSCKSCALWDIDSARDSAGRVRYGAIVKCGCKSTEIRPASVSSYISRETGGWTSPHNGTDCLCYVERKGE